RAKRGRAAVLWHETRRARTTADRSRGGSRELSRKHGTDVAAVQNVECFGNQLQTHPLAEPQSTSHAWIERDHSRAIKSVTPQAWRAIGCGVAIVIVTCLHPKGFSSQVSVNRLILSANRKQDGRQIEIM